MSTALARLAPLLRRQFGVFAAADAARLGVSRSELTRLVERGVVERLWRGVYGLAAAPDTWERRWYAARLAAGPTAAISHRAAAFLHGLEHVGAGRRPDLELVRPGRAQRRTSGPRTHTALYLRPTDVVDLGVWRVTSVAWTLCSLAFRLGPERFERGVDAAVAARRVDLDELRRVGRRFACCPGMPVIRAVLPTAREEVVGTRSDAERRFLRLLVAAGLPLPEADVRVTDAAGRTRYLDFAYRDGRIAIEIDVHPEHGRTLGRRRDGARQNDLVPVWTPLRFDASDLDVRPDQVVAQVRRALASA